MTNIDTNALNDAIAHLKASPSATATEIAGALLPCACVGCPIYPEPCKCVKSCRCSCEIEPYATNRREREQWAMSIAAKAISAGNNK